MAARSQITVLLLLFLLSTEHSFAGTQNKLTPLVEELLNKNEFTPLVKELLSKYRAGGMFSLAVSIPLNQNQDQNKNKNNNMNMNMNKNQNQNKNQNKNQNQDQDQNQVAYQIIQKVIHSDPAKRVKETINNGDVYVGSRMIAAKVLMREKGADHAESRVLDKLCYNPQINKEDLLIFYVYASPCIEKCTNKTHSENILSKINKILHWKSYAVVFSVIFRPRNVPEKKDKKSIEALIKARREALNQVATYQGELGSIGLENIFRCDITKPTMQCVSCSNKGQVVDECVSDDLPSANVNSGRAQLSNKRRVRRDIRYNTGDSSSHISESNKGAEDAPSVDENGNDVTTGEAASSPPGESISLSPTSSDEGNGSDLRTAEEVSSPHIGCDSGEGNGKVSRGKGKVSKGKGGKRRRGKEGKGKVCKGKGGKGKGRRGKGKGRRGKGGKGKGSRRGGRSRRQGWDQEWIFVRDF